MMPALPDDRLPAPPGASTGDAFDPDLYEALRGIAAKYLGGDARRVTLTPTVLVHEAWVRLEGKSPRRWIGPGHLKASLARAMRHVLIDRARSAAANHQHVTVTSSVFAIEKPDLDLEALDLALGRLEREDERCGRIVELMFFGGLEQQEVADILGVSIRTVQGDWAYARSWLLRELDK